MSTASLTPIQINLRKSCNTRRIAHFQSEQNQLTCIQEPYHLTNKIIGFPIKHRTISSSTNPKVAIIIHDEEIVIFPIISEQKIIAVKFTWNEHSFVIINCYVPPKDQLDTAIYEIENILNSLPDEKILITGDFNAQNRLCDGTLRDDSGNSVLDSSRVL